MSIQMSSSIAKSATSKSKRCCRWANHFLSMAKIPHLRERLGAVASVARRITLKLLSRRRMTLMSDDDDSRVTTHAKIERASSTARVGALRIALVSRRNNSGPAPGTKGQYTAIRD